MIIPPQAEPSAIPVLKDTGFNAEAKAGSLGFSLLLSSKNAIALVNFGNTLSHPLAKYLSNLKN